MWMKPWGCTTWQGWNPSPPAFERKTMKECQSLKPSTAQNIPYAIFKLLDSWASHSWGHSTTGQWNNFYLCGPQKSAMWLLVQLLAGIVPKALSNPGPSDGKVPAWLVVPSGKPQSAPPCSHQEGGGHSFAPCLLEFPAPMEHSQIPRLALLVGIWTLQFLILYLLLTGKLEFRGSFF